MRWLRLAMALACALLLCVAIVTAAAGWLPRSAQLAFLSHPDAPALIARYDVMLYDVRHGVQVPVLTLPAAPPQMAWSPDGDTLAYLQSGLSRSLTLFQLDNHQLRDITLGVFLPLTAVPLAWSADGERIALAARRVGADGSMSEVSDVAVIDVTSGRLSSPLPTSYRHITAVQWSPTQPDVLAFAADGHVHTFDFTDPTPEQISQGTSFTWSADGARLVAYSREEAALTVTDIGGASGQVSFNIDGHIAWSPGGDQLVYSHSGANGSFDLFHYNLNSGVTTTFSGMRTYEGQPAWSAGGRWLAYVATLDGHDNIMMYDTARRARFRLRRLDARNWYPVWRPSSGTTRN